MSARKPLETAVVDSRFWEDRWASGNIGFHQSSFDRSLLEYWPQLGVDPAATVFVPLCGKSLDLHWLARRGHEVVGNEVVTQACEEFFQQAEMQPQCEELRGRTSLSCAGIRILLGDFFELQPQDLQGSTAWYDRAAQVALPPAQRIRYYQHLAHLLPSGAVGLSLTMEYPQEQKEGPPYSVEEEELRDLCAGHFKVELLTRMDLLASEPHLVAQGLTRADEAVYRLERT